jgi:hypothetical protein
MLVGLSFTIYSKNSAHISVLSHMCSMPHSPYIPEQHYQALNKIFPSVIKLKDGYEAQN